MRTKPPVRDDRRGQAVGVDGFDERPPKKTGWRRHPRPDRSNHNRSFQGGSMPGQRTAPAVLKRRKEIGRRLRKIRKVIAPAEPGSAR